MNKIIFTILAISLLFFASFHVFQQNTATNIPEKVNNLKERSKKSPILDYQFNMTLNTFEMIEQGNHNESMQIKSHVRAKLIPIYKNNQKTFEVIVDYDVIDIQSKNQQNDGQDQDFSYNPEENSLKEYVFIGIIDEYSGEVLELSAPQGNNHNPYLNQITLELLKSAFPDIRDDQGMLKQSLNGDEDEEEIIETVDLGEVIPHFERFEMEDENGQVVEVLEKTYTQDDFIDIVQIGEDIPEVNFQRLAFVDPVTQITKRNIRHFDFTYEKPVNMILQQSEDGTIYQDDEISEIHVEIDQDLQIKSITEDQMYLQQLFQYVDNADLDIVDQSTPTGELEVNDMTGVEPDYSYSDYANDPAYQELLTASNPLYTRDYNIVEKKFLGQTLAFQIQYKNYGDDSNIQAHILLNSKSIFKLTEVTYKHCGGSYQKNTEKSFNLQIFKASFPVLGIITIPVQADFTIQYGMNYYMGPMNQAHGCELTFAPYFRPGIFASGGVSIAIAKGGIYARGTIANTELKFASRIQGFPPSLKGSISLNVEIKPFNYDIGAWYQHITCSLKKLFRWPPKFKSVCSMSDRKEIKIIEGGIGAISRNFIFEKTWNM